MLSGFSALDAALAGFRKGPYCPAAQKAMQGALFCVYTGGELSFSGIPVGAAQCDMGGAIEI